MASAAIWTPWADLSPNERRNRSNTAAWASWERRALSPPAHALIGTILEKIVCPAKLTKRQLRPSSGIKLQAATAAIVGDVLHAAEKGWAVALSIRKVSFTGRLLGRTAFWDVTGPMIAAGLLDFAAGTQKPEWAVEDGTMGTRWSGRAPVYSATLQLVALAGEHGVSLATIGQHFGPGGAIAPVQLDEPV